MHDGVVVISGREVRERVGVGTATCTFVLSFTLSLSSSLPYLLLLPTTLLRLTHYIYFSLSLSTSFFSF
ncbi:hypothetical protein KFK09_024049 [Dendrobium nobile]|uniref:Transmembrane protein n=1 Tax=Dendrobium nobile TaxID=94219 RepID=A0A8T3ADS3_DENNO|nr:hypothetical protein KFK09_024049 [Dendrobium nobile]